ncbi:MAG: DUF2027 domain-containing protein, partial [Mangrovibacterium sp.]
MKYKLGDRVKFLNDTGGGVITKLVGQNTVHVENEDGFEIPVLITGIIPDEAGHTVPGAKLSVEAFVRQVKPVTGKKAEHPAAEKREEEEESTPVLIEGNDEPAFYLAFVPENSSNPLDGQIRVYLINDCNFYVLYHYSHFKGSEYETREAGKLEPNTKLFLGAISQADISGLPEFSFRLLFYREKAVRLERPVTRKIAVNPVKFYKSGSFSSNGFFREKAMLFKLNQTEMDQALEKLTEKEVKNVIRSKEPARQPQVETKNPELVEVDLHMHELVDSTAGLSNKDMLEFQMKKFREEMEAAVVNQAVKKIVFI